MPRIQSKNCRAIALSCKHKGLSYTQATVRSFLRALDRTVDFKLPPGDISIVFLTDSALGQLHEQFLADPTLTDVITFPGDPDFGFAGEICISVDRACDQAKTYQQSFRSELSLYLIHGWLHLLGLDDRDPAARAAMRLAEQEALKAIESQGVSLPDFSWVAS